MQLPETANPPRRLLVESGVILCTRIASHIYDLSLLSRGGECHFLGRIQQKSDRLWVVNYVNDQPCMPEYLDNWQQATLFLIKHDSYR